jgi:hypothetical protein
MTNPRAFLSYSHQDRDFALSLAQDLRKSGIDVWTDKWEILPGDSLIQKVFTEGLSSAQFFLVLLSSSSVGSKWVREELDAAMIRKMEGVIRIIPILKEPCDIPLSLRTLLWVDLSRNYDEGVRTLVKVMHGVWEKPAVGSIPDYVQSVKHSVGGLSRSASTIGLLMLERPDDNTGFEQSFSGEDLRARIPSFTPEEINDTVDELESYGLVKTLKELGTAPYMFSLVTPTYALFLHFKEALSYDPVADLTTVAAAIAARGEVNGSELQELVKLPPVRINRAIDYLDDFGIATVHRYLGTAPFAFGIAKSTRQTREFVHKHE